MNKLITIFLAAASLTACSKKEDPKPVAPAPAVHAQMERTFTFPGSNSSDTGLTYTQMSMRLTGKLDASALSLGFDVPEGSDFISFTMPAAALSAALPGSYQLQDRQHSTGAVVETRYVYTILNAPSAFKSRLFFSNTNTMVGKVVITAYDSQRRLLAGSFEMAMDGVHDPRESYPAPVPLLCNVKVTGTFENLKLE